MVGDGLRREVISHRAADENLTICAQISQNQYKLMVRWMDGWMEHQ